MQEITREQACVFGVVFAAHVEIRSVAGSFCGIQLTFSQLQSKFYV